MNLALVLAVVLSPTFVAAHVSRLQATASTGVPRQSAADPMPTSEDPGFDAHLSNRVVEIEVRNADGRTVRKSAGIISSDSGYVMTSLDVVVGGTEYLVTGAAVRPARTATPLAVTRWGQIAILQLTGSAPVVSTPARSASPPQAGDTVFAVPAQPATGGSPRKGKVSRIDTEADGSVLLRLDFTSVSGTAVFNSRGALVAIVRGSGKPRPSDRAVFVPDRMPGDWVMYFPARVGDPIAKKPVS